MKFIEIFAIWVMINRARLIICCEDVLWGCDILLWNFGNSESRLNDDTALVYITVKDFNISLREDLQWWRLLLQALRMWCPQLLIRSHAFPILDSRSFDCIAFSAQGFVVGLLFFFHLIHSFQITNFLNYVINSSPLLLLWPENDFFFFFFEEKKRPYLEILTIKTTFLIVLSGIQGW